ncbi:2'-5' RNA ligase family protein [Christiangramia sp. SM2212]|uniref:2'-5' RNA ligase family protein n=1 Tax=Christiangramia sediminicola TaxID=3073267 RepID=A0ABU1EN55_9FLAO|nr:2'-5' RNA ligase family protein [Christiangramia sp. SM2212]MDR5589818.1 2'-5' RNA ligase family protein [Christiangramia sp. SM2212]
MDQHKNPLYFIAILPNPEITSEIREFKEMIRDRFDVKHALKLPAHITLQIPFRVPEERETELIEILEIFAKNLNAFKVEIDGFGRFSKKVIFANISDHKEFIRIHAELQEVVNSFIELKNHEKSSKIHPHLTIAVRDLKRTTFPAVWANFENREYSNSFDAKFMVLLKHNGKTWDVIKEFEFSKI